MSNPITGLHRYYKQDTSSKYFLAKCGECLYSISAAAGHADTEIKHGLTATAQGFFTDFLNHSYFLDGVDGVFKYNGTNVRSVGIIAPTVKCAGSGAGSAGYLGAGDYKYKYTWVDEDSYESNGSPVSDAITATALNTISLTGVLNSTDAKIVSKNIFEHRLQEDWLDQKPIMAVCSGGIHPGKVRKLIHALGRDIIIQGGGAIHAHPGGTIAGAEAMKQAIDAEMMGLLPEVYAKNHLELDIALKEWKN